MRMRTTSSLSLSLLLAACLGSPPAAGIGHVLVAVPGEGPGLVDEALARRGLERRVVARVPHFLAVLPVVAASDLVCTLATRVADGLGRGLGLAAVAPPLELPAFDVVMYWHPRRDPDPVHAWRRGLVRDVASAGVAA